MVRAEKVYQIRNRVSSKDQENSLSRLHAVGLCVKIGLSGCRILKNFGANSRRSWQVSPTSTCRLKLFSDATQGANTAE